MSALGLGIRQFKAGFFDTEAIRKQVKKDKRAVFSKMGAFIRTRARSSIRTRKKSSPPGQPPSSHQGSLKRLIFFAYDAATDSVIVGPASFASKQGDARLLLEKGGDVTRRTKAGKSVRMHYRGNPYMKPAGDAEAPKFKELIRTMVK